jgi:peptidoglycan/LPS O-acetylase OafA/YrhL
MSAQTYAVESATTRVPAATRTPEAADGQPEAADGGPPQAADGGRPGRPRLAWLDALRGIAALCVVYQHFGARVLPAIHAAVTSVFDPGLYGVLVFFLISGYIVPASLERRGSLRTFWISRLFRLFPLFVVVIALTLLLAAFGLASLHGANQNVAAVVLSHLFMLNDLLGGPNLIVVIWTLSYEMVFYLLLTALFTTGLHRRSGAAAVTFACGALLLGGVLPNGWLSRSFGLTPVALTADVLVLAGLAVAVAARGLPRTLGAWAAAGTALALVVFNEYRFAYEGLTILALMFAGTMIYRARQGQAGRRRAIAVAVGVFSAAMVAGAWHIPAVSPGSESALQQREWIVSVALAGLTFAAGLTLHKLRVPAVLAWLGLVSYSVYLLLPAMLDLYDSIPFPPSYQHQAWLQAGVSIVFLAALLACSTMTYYLVEAPTQRLGRRVAAWLDSRLGNAGNEAQRPHVAVLQGRLDQFLSIEAFSFVQVRPGGSHGHLDAALD